MHTVATTKTFDAAAKQAGQGREGKCDRQGSGGDEGCDQTDRGTVPEESIQSGQAERKNGMSKKVYNRMMAGLNEVLETAKGDQKPARLYVPPEINVRGIRKKLGLSQDAFAKEFGFSIHQIRDWEQERSRPLDGLRAYLMIIERNPQAVLHLLRTSKATRRRNAA
jgi:putative transcriptional regulator